MARRSKQTDGETASGTRLREDQRSLSVDLAGAMPRVTLHTPVRQPLVFRKRVRHVDATARPGDLVEVHAGFKGDTEEAPKVERLLGYGLYNPRAEIALRMVSFGDTLPDEAYWSGLVDRAVCLRLDGLHLNEHASAYRVIHAESDGFPGFMVDRYGDVLSAEVFSLAMYQRSRALMEMLCRKLDVPHYVIRPAPHVLSQEGFTADLLQSPALPRSVTIQEYGTRFRVRLDAEGHKTGFFCDQRENRKRLASFCRDRSVLDLCCYTGGFSVQAKKLGGASDVIGVDLDQAPLVVARENANLNQCKIRFVNADIFPYMRDAIREGRKFDVVVLDPPKLIRSRQEFEEGRKAHFDMNRLAVRLVRPGGLFLTCTCAGLLRSDDFLNVVISSMRGSERYSHTGELGDILRRDITGRIIERTGAGPDHPIGYNCPETEYLHAIWMVIDG